jgi:hypothetical protein
MTKIVQLGTRKVGTRKEVAARTQTVMKGLFSCTRIPTIEFQAADREPGQPITEWETTGLRLEGKLRYRFTPHQKTLRCRLLAGRPQSPAKLPTNRLARRIIVTHSKSRERVRAIRNRIRHRPAPLILQLGSRSRARRPPIGESSNEKVPS